MSTAPTQFDPVLNQPVVAAPRRSTLDMLGIGLSALCVVHCLALPFLLVALPQLSSIAGIDHTFHIALGIILPLIAGAALFQGYRRHKVPMTLVLGGLGLAFVWMALFVPGCSTCTTEHDHASHVPMVAGLPLHNVVTTVGSILLISAHVMNWRACKCGPCHSTCHAS